MKLYQEFKSISNEFPKDRILIAENNDLGTLKQLAIDFALKLKQDVNIDVAWTDPLSKTTSVALILDIDDKSELVIRR